jgi:glycosyltransferase involved in cell wall biosynthesis
MSALSSFAPPLVSIIIPAYNAEHYLKRAIDSVLAQRYAPKEIIVVDDGSTDGTQDVARRYGPPVHLLAQANSGPDKARNHGVSHARGELIAFLDADDEYLPQRLEKCVTPFAESTVGLTFCWAINHFADGTETIRGLKKSKYRTYPRHLWQPPRHCTPATTVRKSCFLQCGGFDRPLLAYADIDLWIRIRERSRIVEIPDPLVRVFLRPDSRSHKKKPQQVQKDYFRIIEDALRRRPDLYGPHRDQILGDAWFVWGTRHWAAHRPHQAARCFVRALRHTPNLAAAKFLLASLLSMLRTRA